MPTANALIPHPAVQLFMLLESLAPYPDGVLPLRAQAQNTAFFPGGYGLWAAKRHSPLPPMPVGGVMILGHDFDSEVGYERCLQGNGENLQGPTWRNLLDLISRAGMDPGECFFTNFFMGIRKGAQATGVFPGSRNADFVQRCRGFFARQLEAQRPRLLITLGRFVPALIAPASAQLAPWLGSKTLSEIDRKPSPLIKDVVFDDCSHTRPIPVVALTHPCYRPPNIARRRFQSAKGDAAELEMLLVATQLSARR